MIGGAFVTGIDTGVGKPFVGAALLHLLAGHRVTIAGLKPVATGPSLVDGVHLNEDVASLRTASSVSTSRPCAPHRFILHGA